MIQKQITLHNGTALTVDQAAEGWKELKDRTDSNEQGYNSIGELAPKVKNVVENQVTGHEVHTSYADLPAVGVNKVSYKVSNDITDSTLNGFYHWDIGTTAYIKDGESLVQVNLNAETAKNNEREAVLIEGSDAYSHAKRVKEDGGTTVDIIPLDDKIRKFRNWDWVMLANSVKASKVYGQIPNTADADATFSRATPVEEINKNGVSVLAGANEPRLDFLGKHIEETDESFYSFDGVSDYISLPNPTFSTVENPFSAIFKFKTGSDISTIQILYSNTFNATNILVAGIVNGSFSFSTLDGVTSETISVPISANTTYDVAITKPNTHTGLKKIYINGVLQVLGTTEFLNTTTNIGQYLGVRTNISLYFMGDIYISETFNTELTAQEIEDRFNGLPIPEKYKGANNVDLLNGVDFTNWYVAGGASVIDSDTFSTSSTGGIKKGGILIQGEVYVMRIIGSTTSSSMDIRDENGATVYETGITGAFDLSILFTSVDTGLYIRSTGVGSTDVTMFEVFKAGNTLNLSKGKGGYGEDTVVNGDFDTDTDWTKGAGWSIGGGVATCNGSQTSVSYISQGDSVVDKIYKIKYTIVSISSGNLTAVKGGSGGRVNSVTGVKEDYIKAVNTFGLFIGASSDFVGTIDNVSVKEVSTWYDLDHGIKTDVFASLNQSNGFGNIRIPIESEAALLLEGGAVINNFLNSGTPADQIVSGLTVGVDYTLNFGGEGIIEIQSIGVEQGGFATETNHFTFNAKTTSVDIALIGVGVLWVNLTNSKTPYNHIPTSGATVAKVAESFTLEDLQSKGFVGKNKGSLFLEFAAGCSLKERSSGSNYIYLRKDGSYTGAAVTFNTDANDNIRIVTYNGGSVIDDYKSNISIKSAKVLITWSSETLYIYINGALLRVVNGVSNSNFNALVVEVLNDTFIRVVKKCLRDTFTNKLESIELTVI